MYFALLIGLVPFVLIAYTNGYSAKHIMNSLIKGLFKLNKTYQILLLIGAATSLWMASGTLPWLIYNALSLIHPHYFLLLTFLLTWGMTLILGSALGSAGMIGVLFMTMARAGHYSLGLTAGAVVSAIYLGERTTPLSSCANIVADATELPVLTYIKANFKASSKSILALLILYTILSRILPLNIDTFALQQALSNAFDLSIWVIAPLIVLLFLIIFSKNIVFALSFSLLSAVGLGVVVQGYDITSLLEIALSGFKMENGNLLSNSIKASGIIGMLTPLLTIMIAALYTGLFDETNLLDPIKMPLMNIANQTSTRFATLIASLLGGAIGCSQTFSILFTHQLVKSRYGDSETGRTNLSVDIANTAVITPSLIPWNASSSVPASLLGCGYAFIPYAFALYLFPIAALVNERLHATPIPNRVNEL